VAVRLGQRQSRDEHRLAREREADAGLGRVAMGLEAAGLLLSNADKDHALMSFESTVVPSGDIVFARLAWEVNYGQRVLLGEGLDGVDEALQQWAKQGRRRDRGVQPLAAEAATCPGARSKGT